VSSHTPGFDPRPFLVGYVVDKMTLGEFLISNFCRVLNVVFFLPGNSPASELYAYPPMKMEQTERSETSAYKIQTPGNYPEESIQQKLWETFFYKYFVLPCHFNSTIAPFSFMYLSLMTVILAIYSILE